MTRGSNVPRTPTPAFGGLQRPLRTETPVPRAGLRRGPAPRHPNWTCSAVFKKPGPGFFQAPVELGQARSDFWSQLQECLR